ncbi:MAG TPA: phosphatase PAP2 family protein [Caulobacteraceae bacterium]|nr:phosphatase PAP2 family protein [Caulobacteraceae bacterium]
MRASLLRPVVAVARFARAELVVVAALGLLTLCIMGFMELADDVAEADTRAFDQAILDSVRAPGDPSDPIGPHWLEIAMADVTALGAVAVLGIVALVVAGFLFIQRRPLAGVTLLTALLGGVAMSQSLKLLFGRERPPLPYQAAEAVNASFPSGHAMLSAVAYLTIGAIVAKALPRRRLKTYVMTVAVLLTLIVGLSRVYLGVHWASDVLGGWMVGAAWAAACWLAAWAIERWQGREGMSRPQPVAHPAAAAAEAD